MISVFAPPLVSLAVPAMLSSSSCCVSLKTASAPAATLSVSLPSRPLNVIGLLNGEAIVSTSSPIPVSTTTRLIAPSGNDCTAALTVTSTLVASALS